MGKICLEIKANLENVTNLMPNGDDFRWYLKLKCTNCGDQRDKWVYLSLDQTVSTTKGRAEAHLVTKCKLCGRDCSLQILRDTITAYRITDSDTFQKLVCFDCRGLEPFDFSPRSGFVCEAVETRTVFDDVNLEEKEWVDYDDKLKQSVGIYEFEHRFVSIK